MNQSDLDNKTMLTSSAQREIQDIQRECGTKEPAIKPMFTEQTTETPGNRPKRNDSYFVVGPIQELYLSDITHYMSPRTHRV